MDEGKQAALRLFAVGALLWWLGSAVIGVAVLYVVWNLFF